MMMDKKIGPVRETPLMSSVGQTLVVPFLNIR